jgi:hypothetical protein
MVKNTKQKNQPRNTIGLILLFIGIILGLFFLGWFFTLSDIFIIIGVIGIILIVIGLSIIK